MQLPQAFEDAIVEIASVNERCDQRTQGQRSAVQGAFHWRHDPAFQPGKAFPLTPLDKEIFFQHRHADCGRTRIAVRPQRQIDAEDLPVVGDIADQRVEPMRDPAEIFMRADRKAAIGLPIFFVDIDQVDVG